MTRISIHIVMAGNKEQVIDAALPPRYELERRTSTGNPDLAPADNDREGRGELVPMTPIQ